MAQKGDFSCRLLEEQDWAIHRQQRLHSLAETQSWEKFDAESAEKPAYWQEELASERLKHFGLFHKNEIIGATTVALWRHDEKKPDADASPVMVFTGSYISQEHRGQKLGDLLYEARIKYALEQEKYATVQTDIWEGNASSRAVALRNGFTDTGVSQPAEKYHVYALDLNALRAHTLPKRTAQPQKSPA